MNSGLQVTSCRVFSNNRKDDRLLGFASIILNNEFAVHGLKIVRGNKGIFVAMPNKRHNDGEFRDIAHPISVGLREHIEEVVLEKFRNPD